MERSVEVATGESVAFSYELAGLGSRFLAVFVDFLIQAGVAIGILLVFVLIGLALPAAKGSAAGAADKIGDAIVIALFVVLAFIVFSGYFMSSSRDRTRGAAGRPASGSSASAWYATAASPSTSRAP